MAVSLEESKNNATDDVNVAVIDEFRKTGVITDSLIFDDVVNPAGGGDTLTYGYRRLITQATAATREINTEYADQNVETKRESVDLAVMGGSFAVDRVTAKLGPAASANVALNMGQKVKSTNAKFADLVINGDTALDAHGFDGLDKALYGSDTEHKVDAVTDWSDFDTNARAEHKALDLIDEFLALLDGTPTVIVGNSKSLARVRAAARRAGMYTRNPIEGLVGQNGRPIERESYGGIVFGDAGAKAGTNDLIVPVVARGTVWAITAPSGAGKYTITVDGHATDELDYNANAAAIKTALEALPNVGTDGVAVSGTKATFPRLVALSAQGVAAAEASAAVDGGAAGTGLTDLYAYRVGLDGFHGVSTIGGELVQTWLPDFTKSGAVKRGEVELGPVAVALKATKAAAVLRNLKVQ
ncbi:MAG: major capsid protein [Leucobacter sp.]